MRLIAPGDARTRVPGQFYRVFNRRYQKWVVLKWPKKRPVVSQKTQKQNRDFAIAMSLVRRATGAERVAAEKFTKAVPFLYQDALMAGALGTMVESVQTPGGLLRSYRLTNTEINQALDSISAVPGSMLVRGNLNWMAILPGNGADVLTMDTTGGTPVWAPSSGGGGGASALMFLDALDHVYPSGTTTLQKLVQFNVPANTITSVKQQVSVDWVGDIIASGGGSKRLTLQINGVEIGGFDYSGVNAICSGHATITLLSTGIVRVVQNQIANDGVWNVGVAAIDIPASFQWYKDLAVDTTTAINIAVCGLLATAGANKITARRLAVSLAAVP